jgi:hypothetical protein
MVVVINQTHLHPCLKLQTVNKPTVRNAGDPMTNIAYGQTQDIKAGQTKADQAALQVKA